MAKFTIPLRDAWANKAKYNRTRVAVSAVSQYLRRHLKAENIKLGPHINKFVWKQGTNPPARITVNAEKDKDGIVKAELASAPQDFLKEEKKEKKAPGRLRRLIQAEPDVSDIEVKQKAAEAEKAVKQPESKLAQVLKEEPKPEKTTDS
ncbi:hypothetical protein J4475_00045 [Candidatus Woesearchaeota archaeon]|nr:hypothetical protein [Candidatus Woesearchaeota archaeon]